MLNSGAVVDCEHFADNDKVQGILFGWQGGLEGGAAVADILCGDVCPSGKLADTIPVSYYSYQNAEEFLTGFEHLDYYDDIYVGYRYFETVPGAAERVRYPFGFGLSYTDFELGGVLCGETDGKIVVSVNVKNIGSVPGKETVQLYYSAPQGVLGKPAKELAAFAKTHLLNPGESETLALSFDIADMASFDDLGKVKKAAYVLEPGKYSFYLGNSVRSAEKSTTNTPLRTMSSSGRRAGCCARSSSASAWLPTAALSRCPWASRITPSAKRRLSRQTPPSRQSCLTTSARRYRSTNL